MFLPSIPYAVTALGVIIAPNVSKNVFSRLFVLLQFFCHVLLVCCFVASFNFYAVRSGNDGFKNSIFKKPNFNQKSFKVFELAYDVIKTANYVDKKKVPGRAG